MMLNFNSTKLGRCLGLTILFSLGSSTLLADSTFSSSVDENGNISLSKEFRLSMTHLGSWYVPTGGASGFHDVYTEAESVEYFRNNGSFPDGATLIKELRESHSGDYTTGPGVNYSTQSIKQWFVMVKDTNGRFADNPLWGDGWGWALFKPDNPTVNVATDYKTDCLGCHIPAKENDWVYTEAYPILDSE